MVSVWLCREDDLSQVTPWAPGLGFLRRCRGRLECLCVGREVTGTLREQGDSDAVCRSPAPVTLSVPRVGTWGPAALLSSFLLLLLPQGHRQAL